MTINTTKAIKISDIQYIYVPKPFIFSPKLFVAHIIVVKHIWPFSPEALFPKIYTVS